MHLTRALNILQNPVKNAKRDPENPTFGVTVIADCAPDLPVTSTGPRVTPISQICFMRSGSPDLGPIHSRVLKTEFVVHRVSQFLFAAEVTFGGLNRSVSEQKLDLLQFTA